MASTYWKSGEWNANCDVCGFRFKSGQLRENWQGLMVCSEDYETRHPQDLLRVRDDDPSVPWTRPEVPDVFINVCYLWDRLGYADLGTADCSRADNTSITYKLAVQLKQGY